MQIEIHREFVFCWYFLVYKGCPDWTLCVAGAPSVCGGSADPRLLRHLCLLAAKITVVVTDQLSQNKPIERLCQTLRVLDLQGERIECFLYFFCFFALVALEQISVSACVHVVNEFPQRMGLDACLQPIKKHRNELLYVLLDHYVHWLSSEWLIGLTKRIGYKVKASSFVKVGKNALNLMQEIVVYCPVFRMYNKLRLFLVVYAHKQVSKGTIDV